MLEPDVRAGRFVRGKEDAKSRTLVAGILMAWNVGVKIVCNLWIARLCLAHLGEAQFGQWIVLQNVASYFMLSEAGLGQVLVNYEGEAYSLNDRLRVNILLTTTCILYCSIVLIVWMIAAASIRILPIHELFFQNPAIVGAGPFKRNLLLYITTTLLLIPPIVFPGTLVAVRDLHVKQALDCVIPILLLVATWLALGWSWGIRGLVLFPPLTQLLWTIGYYPILVRRHPFIRLSIPYFRRWILGLLLSNSFYFLLISVALIAQRSAGNLLVGRFSRIADVPQMYAAMTLFRVLGWALLDIVSRALQPYIILFNARGETEKVVFYAGLATKLNAFCAICFATIILGFGQYIVMLWLGIDSYIGMVSMSFIAAAFLIDVLYLPTVNTLVAVNRQRVLAFLMASYAGLLFVMGGIGSRIGSQNSLVGISVGMFGASILCQGFVMPFVGARGFRMSVGEYWRKFMKKPMFMCVCVIAANCLILGFTGSAIVARVIMILLVLALAGVISWKAMLLPTERQWIRESGIAMGLF